MPLDLPLAPLVSVSKRPVSTLVLNRGTSFGGGGGLATCGEVTIRPHSGHPLERPARTRSRSAWHPGGQSTGSGCHAVCRSGRARCVPAPAQRSRFEDRSRSRRLRRRVRDLPLSTYIICESGRSRTAGAKGRMSERERGRKDTPEQADQQEQPTNCLRRERHWQRRPGMEKRASGVGGETRAASRFPKGTWSCWG